MSNSSKIRILIVDDHPLMRMGISAMISAQPDMIAVAQTGSAEEALEMYPELLPDITLMDLRLPKMSGVDAIRAIRLTYPKACFVVLTTYEGDEDIHQALEAGAQSYLIKGMPHEALASALRRVHAGHRYLPSPISKVLASRPADGELSVRERQVLELLAQGETNKEIAVHLGIAEATVKCHVSTILLRMQVNDRTKAVVAALHRGLLHL